MTKGDSSVLHFTRGGRFLHPRTMMVTTIGRNWPACGARTDDGGALDRSNVTCKRCLAFLKARADLDQPT